MAVDIFLKLTDIEGEAQDSTHENEIDILAYSWGASQAGTTHMGGGGGGGKANFQDLSVTKYIDASSVPLLQYLTQGTHIDEGTLTVRKAGEDPLEYIVFEMEDIIVTSISTGGSGGEDRLTENVTLNFSVFTSNYAQQAEEGGEDATKDFAWDIAANAPV